MLRRSGRASGHVRSVGGEAAIGHPLGHGRSVHGVPGRPSRLRGQVRAAPGVRSERGVGLVPLGGDRDVDREEPRDRAGRYPARGGGTHQVPGRAGGGGGGQDQEAGGVPHLRRVGAVAPARGGMKPEVGWSIFLMYIICILG